MTVYLGVDPGATGAIACLDNCGDLWWVEDMPNPLTGPLIRDLLDSHSLTGYSAAIERVHAMPRNGSIGNFKLGEAYATIRCSFAFLGIPYTLITPQQWKRAMRVTADKDTTRDRAIALWATRSNLFARKKDHGRAEAALIARWLYEDSRRATAA
jgi:hypothetical protein